jgi:DNA topoisomerase I
MPAGTAFCLQPFMESAVQTLTHRQLLKIDKDYEAAASVANLLYVSNRDGGITRVKKGNGFSYRLNGKTITDEKTLNRIKKLAIPPAWTKVWICPYPEGHIQATGYDARNRKQYRYHPRWNALQHETKFHRMIEFGKVLPILREQVRKDLEQAGFPESKVLAMVISLIERTSIRVGNDGYEKLYGSYGLTTMKNNHVDIKGDKVTFSFKGKKGVYHKVLLKSKKFARIVKQCKAIPGKELFQYYDESGEPRKVDSGQVNQYLKDCLGMDFTTKDLRTWAGTLSMLEQLKLAPASERKTDFQKNITAALQAVSAKLGNTVAVCKKYYVHPEIVRMYKENELASFLSVEDVDEEEKQSGLCPEEQVLMRILKIIEKAKVEISV